MDRKGFPESYDMEKLINFLNEVKSGKDEIKAPVYSLVSTMLSKANMS